jgi:DNA-directed RNA polymerase subunit RPC12/RpoP
MSDKNHRCFTCGSKVAVKDKPLPGTQRLASLALKALNQNSPNKDPKTPTKK